MDGLANLFNDEVSGAERATSITSSDLDPFLLQGDDQTWAVEDWNWDPFNMFAAPKEVPNVACCQALKRRKVANDTATSAAPQTQQQQQQQGACQPCHGAGAQRVGPPPPAAAACCSMGAGLQSQHAPPQQPAGPIQAAFGSLMPRVVETCGASNMMCHGPNMVASAPAMALAAAGPMEGAAFGGMGGGMGMPGNMGIGGNLGMGGGMGMGGWPGMAMLGGSGPAAPAYFNGGGQGPLAALGWGGQSMGLQMPNLAMSGFPGGHLQCAPAMPMPSYQQGPNSGIFNQHASMALPHSALPSPALASSGDTTSLQGSADNGNGNGKPPCCSGNRLNGAPSCSGGRQADSSNKAPAAPLPSKQNQGPKGGRGAVDMAAGGELSDFAISDSEEEEEVGRGRAPAALRAAPLLPHQVPRDVVALQDLADDSGLMVCQVPGCSKDLTHLKEYHQRYRICDVHIKLQQVLKDGRLQRFCQQCGRFHELTAFDGNRKSCRDQLSKHNARRRRRAQADQTKNKPTAQQDAAADLAAAAAGGAGGAAAFPGDVGKFLACLMSNPTQLHALRLLLGVSTHPALPPPMAPGGAPGGSDTNASDQARTYSLARDILGGRSDFTPAFESEHRMIRLSMKLFNKTPADLPADLRNQVTSWLASAPVAMEASIRPGCVFLTVQMLVDEVAAAAAEQPGALAGLARHLLGRTGCAFWHGGMYTLQLGTEMLLVKDGVLCGDHRGVGRDGGDARFPTIGRLGPLAAVAGQPAVLKVHGQNLDAPGCAVIVRWGIKHVKVALQALSAHRALVRLPPFPADLVGPVWVEVARGAYVSPAKQLLVAADAALVEEINRLDVRNGPLPLDAVEGMVRDLALVLQHIAGQNGVASQLPHATIALKARRLLAIAFDMGWAAVASAVLPLACARCSCAAEMVAAIHAASVPAAASAPGADARGLTLLHRAVRSGSVPLVAGMLAWGDAHGYRWRVDAAGPAGITPLHLSAMMDDARMGLLLMDHCGWPAAFTQLKTDGGVTPFHMAFQMGHYQVDKMMAALGGLHQVDAQAGANNAAGHAPPAGHRSRCGSTCAGGLGVGLGVKLEEGEDAKGASRHAGRAPPPPPHHHNNAGGGGSSCAELDPCEMCACTLPPLLLSIMASCTDCGRRRMCMEADPAAAGAGGRCADCACGGARPAARAESGEVCCSPQHGTIFSITALCQGCHANRVLAVA